MPSNGSRRGRRLIAATVAIAATGGTAALAFTGQPNSGGPPTSAAPDLTSATITRTVQPNSPLGPQARFCFDEVVNAGTINGTDFRVMFYDSLQRIASTNATIDTNDPTCVIVTYAAGNQIQQATIAYYNDGAVADNANTQSPSQSAPLTGTEVTPTAGRTTAPDLVDVSVDPGATPPNITYTFDEALDPTLPTGGGAASIALANKFGFYVDTDNGNAPRRGSTILGIDNKSIVVSFTVAQNVNAGKLFFNDSLGAGASPQDRIVGCTGTCKDNTISPIGHVTKPANASLSGAPTLVSAAKQAGSGGQIVDLTFAQAVIPGNVGGAAPNGNVVAYRADADPIAGTYAIGTSGANTSVLPLTMPSTTQRDPNSVVRVGIRPGLVRNQANDRDNAIAHAAISTEPAQAGLSDGPDLLTTSVDDANNRVTYNFDEALRQTPDPSGTEFRVINADASTAAGQAGTANVSADRKTVSVKFGGSVSGSSIAGVSNDLGALFDAVDDAGSPGNFSSPGSVSTTIVACQPGTCPDPTATASPSPTATPSVTATPTPTVTPPQRVIIRANVKKLKQKGSKVTGRVAANNPCKSGRNLKLRKGGKTIATGKSKGNGNFTLKSKKARSGKLVVKVQRRKLTRGGVQIICKAAQKRV